MKKLFNKFIFLLIFGVFLFPYCCWADQTPITYRDAEDVINSAGNISSADLSNQNKGKYPRLDRAYSLGAIQHAWDRSSKERGTYTVTYTKNELIRIRLREFMTTTIIFPSWEKVEKIRIGDPTYFEAVKEKDHIVSVMPKEGIGVDSNITVIGKSGLVYTFYVRSEGYNSGYIPDLRVHVHVPGEIPFGFSDQEEPEFSNKKQGVKEKGYTEEKKDEYPGEIPVRLRKLNFQWSMCGDESIAPQQVYSDGIRTWFNYGDHLEEHDLPAVFQVINSIDTPVRYRIEDGMMVVLGVGTFTLRGRNGGVVCVYSTPQEGE